MPGDAATYVFVIRRLHVTLKVKLYANNHVRVDPWQCKEEDLRLWSSIAQTQALLARTQLYMKQDARPVQVLLSRFRHDGWEAVIVEEENCKEPFSSGNEQ